MGRIFVNIQAEITNRAATSLVESAPELILSRVRVLCQRRLLWLRHLQALHTPENDGNTLDRVLIDEDSPIEEAHFYKHDANALGLTQRATHLSQCLAQSENRFQHLVNTLSLTMAEADLLQICFASSIDPGLGAVYGALTGVEGRVAPTESLAARVCGYGRLMMMTPAGKLQQWNIIRVEAQQPGEPPLLRLDPYIASYLHGNDELDPQLNDCCKVNSSVHSPLPNWPVNEIADRVAQAIDNKCPSLVQIIAPPMSGRRTFAACVADTLGAVVICVDTNNTKFESWDEFRMLVQRQALLNSCAVAWTGNNARLGPSLSPGFLPLQFTVVETVDEIANAFGWHEERVHMPSLSTEHRRELWQRFLPASGDWDEAQLTHIAERFTPSVGEIAHIAAQRVNDFDKVCELTRNLSRTKLGDLAQLIDCPFNRADLQVTSSIDEQLQEFMFEARERISFWEQPSVTRLFPRGTGLIGLLAGPPGTGKTMTAQVIAGELGLDLFRIDLASTVNKYIGETAKNLRRLFNRAACMNAVLLFDEADALFARRTNVRDSHDRYANADTNYLLQLVEDYPGVALLATNKRQQMDDAFVRRVRYVFYIARPDTNQRLSIWQHTLRELASPECVERLGPDLEQLAQQFSVTGAQIKNAVLASVFLSRSADRPINTSDIVRGLERQLADHGGNVGLERTS